MKDRLPSRKFKAFAAAETPAFPSQEIIDKAVKYIKTAPARRGVQYNSKGGGAAGHYRRAIACLFNAGEYDSQYVPN